MGGVVDLLQRFVEAFNRGDADALTTLIPTVSSRSALPEPGKFSFFAVSGKSGTAGIHDQAGVLSYVAIRHSHGERWDLLRIDMSGSWWAGGVDMIIDISRRADDFGQREVGVQAGVDCQAGIVSSWGVADRAIVPESWFWATPGPTAFG